MVGFTEDYLNTLEPLIQERKLAEQQAQKLRDDAQRIKSEELQRAHIFTLTLINT